MSLDANDQRRGQQFERVCKWLLQNHPIYRQEIRHVWLWDEWPGRWGGDAGIDLVAKDSQEGLWAIQAKVYHPAYRVTKADIDSFLSESNRRVFSYRLLIATTDLIGPTARRTMENQEKQVGFLNLSDLEAAGLDWPTRFDDLRPRSSPPKKPRPHQREAVNAVVRGFKKSDRGQLLMACGTGKTLGALFTMERLDATRTLIVVPSLSLLSQTLAEWSANRTAPFASLAVCSDDTVGEQDAIVATTTELGMPVTTKPNEIAAFLRRQERRVVFATYQSSQQIAKAYRLGRVPRLDLLIADEAHRCAGYVSSDFTTVLDARAIPTRRRLFMTATPRFFTGRLRKEARQADLEIASMDDETRFGPVFYRLSFGEAITRNLLTDYQVAVVGVSDSTYGEWASHGRLVHLDGHPITDARTLAAQIGLAKAMRRYNLSRTISFHSRVVSARHFALTLPQIIAAMPRRQRPVGNVWADVVSGEMSAGQRNVKLRRLRSLAPDEAGVLTNARCLSEGVDVPTLDGVAFIDPRRSEVDIVQAVGRAIRKTNDKTLGTIVIPVLIEQGEDPEVTLDGSVFKPVWDVVRALRSHDEQLGKQLDELRRELGRSNTRLSLPAKIHIDLPARVGADFLTAFDARLVKQTTTAWEYWFGLLQRFVEREGHAMVPAPHMESGYRLGIWVITRRQEHRLGRLSQARTTLFENLPGWTWEPSVWRFTNGILHLRGYARTFGHCEVPTSYCCEDGFRLGMWVANRRADLGKGNLGAQDIQAIESVPGWQWGYDSFGKRFEDLRRYVASHGDAKVPDSYQTAEGFLLGAWVVNKRMAYKKGTLPADQCRLLQRLPGWMWDARPDVFPNGINHLREFLAKRGHAMVPGTYVTKGGFGLGAWVSHQRVYFRDGTLSADRVAELEAIPGWSWNPQEDAFANGLRHLRRFIAENGDAQVRQHLTEDGFFLGGWVETQRAKHRRGRLSPGCVMELEAIPGWSWNPQEDAFANGLRHLREFVAEYGHCRPAALYTCADGFRLGGWVRSRRGRRVRCSPDQIADLDAVPGWTWEQEFRRDGDGEPEVAGRAIHHAGGNRYAPDRASRRDSAEH